MIDVFVIQSIFIIIARLVFGLDIPGYCVWATVFGTGAFQRLYDYVKIAKRIGLHEEIEPSVLHSIPVQLGAWIFFYFGTIYLALVWGSYDVGEGLRGVFQSNNVFRFFWFYIWGLLSSVLFDLIAYHSKLFWPFSEDRIGLNLVNRLDGFWGFILVMIITFYVCLLVDFPMVFIIG